MERDRTSTHEGFRQSATERLSWIRKRMVMAMAVQLASISVFPIKSLDPVPLKKANFLPSAGLENDRRYALFDESGRVVNGKRTPLVHTIESLFASDFRELKLGTRDKPEQERYRLPEETKRVNDWFSAHFDYPVVLRENQERGFPDDTLSSGPTVIAAETLQTVADWFGLSFDETQARFRPNLVVEGGGPFWEDRLYAKPGSVVTFRIGDVLLFGTNCCARCAVPGRDSLTGETTPDFVKRFTAARRDHLPPWACQEVFDHYYRLMVNMRLYAPADGGSIGVGDPIDILS